jgi:hypothetical protein
MKHRHRDLLESARQVPGLVVVVGHRNPRRSLDKYTDNKHAD